MGAVLLVENDEELLEMLGDLIPAVCGAPCIALRSMAELLRVDERALACELAMLDINLDPGEPTGLDIYAWLRARGFAGRIVFLTGHGQDNELVRRACQLGHARVYRKPLGLAELRALIRNEPLPPTLDRLP
jgi:DNA-binding response OmpR family regulator